MPPYHERQVGGNCRLHALNTMLGAPVVGAAKLSEFHKAFDALHGTSVPSDFDCVQSDTMMLISAVLEASTEYRTLYVPVGGLSNVLREFGASRLQDVLDPDAPGFMVFTAGHIWTVRRDESKSNVDEWWNMDSLSLNPSKLRDLDALTSPTHRDRGYLLLFSPQGVAEQLMPLLRNRVCRCMRMLDLRSVDEFVAHTIGHPEQLLGELEPALLSFARLVPGLAHCYRTVCKDYVSITRDDASLRHFVVPMLLGALVSRVSPG
jgi:hypothetical protein